MNTVNGIRGGMDNHTIEAWLNQKYDEYTNPGRRKEDKRPRPTHVVHHHWHCPIFNSNGGNVYIGGDGEKENRARDDAGKPESH